MMVLGSCAGDVSYSLGGRFKGADVFLGYCSEMSGLGSVSVFLFLARERDCS
jgi:hypothetical protein